MGVISYQERMREHLSHYKVSTLGISKDGIWRRKQREYPHILPFEFQRLNILEPYREQFWSYFETANIKLHPDFHHLSSSQAMCFNLFFPFIADSGEHLPTLREVFATDGPITDARYEAVVDPVDATNFDFYVKTSKSSLLFELKLTETAFGKAKHDAAHISKFKKVYAPRISEKFRDSFCTCDMFLDHYQIMRNVWNLEIGTADTLVCLVPNANSCLHEELRFLANCVSESYRRRIEVHFLEDVITSIEAAAPICARFKQHYRLFREKYLVKAS